MSNQFDSSSIHTPSILKWKIVSSFHQKVSTPTAERVCNIEGFWCTSRSWAKKLKSRSRIASLSCVSVWDGDLRVCYIDLDKEESTKMNLLGRVGMVFLVVINVFFLVSISCILLLIRNIFILMIILISKKNLLLLVDCWYFITYWWGNYEWKRRGVCRTVYAIAREHFHRIF